MARMQSPEDSLFTPTEAAVLTRLPVKAVNNAIDKKIVSSVSGRRAGQADQIAARGDTAQSGRDIIGAGGFRRIGIGGRRLHGDGLG